MEELILVEKKFARLGTQIHVQLVVPAKDQEKAEQDLRMLELLYHEQENRFSRFNPQSELSFFNSHLNQIHPASTDFYELASLCLEYYDKTQGWFDPRILTHLEDAGYKSDFKTADFSQEEVGSFSNEHKIDLKEQLITDGNTVMFKERMDFSGIAKGFITDKAAKKLRDLGWKNFIVDSGGDMYIAGRNLEDSHWIIAVEGFAHENLLLELSNQSIATSGISRRKWEIQGQRFHHLINPKEPKDFRFNLRSVTVISDTTTDADVWAKVFYLMGKDDGLASADQRQQKSIFLDYSGSAYASAAAKANIYQHKN